MGPKNPQRKEERTPVKSVAKKPKLGDGECSAQPPSQRDTDMKEVEGQLHMASSDVNKSRRSLDLSDSSQQPPQWFADFFQAFEARLEQRMENVVTLKFEQVLARINEHEDKLIGVDFEIKTLQSEVKKLVDEKEGLVMKLDELENRGRRNNLVFFGVPERQDKEDTLATVSDIINNFVGLDDFSCDTQIERCHRTPTFKPLGNPNPKPRIIHVAFTTFYPATIKYRVDGRLIAVN